MSAKRPRIFVGLFGLNRSLKWTRPSIERNILAPLAAAPVDVVTAAHFNMPPVIDNLRTREKGVRHRNLGWAKLPLNAVLLEGQSPDALPDEVRTWMKPVFPDDTAEIAQTRSNLIHQLHSLRRLWTLTEILDRDAFDAFLLFRPDLEYIDPLDVGLVLDRIVGGDVDLITPEWGTYGGLNDRFALCSPRGAGHYAQRLSAVDEFCRAHDWLQAESLLDHVARKEQLKLGTMPMRAMRVRSNGATWREYFKLTPYQNVRSLARKRLVRLGLPSLP